MSIHKPNIGAGLAGVSERRATPIRITTGCPTRGGSNGSCGIQGEPLLLRNTCPSAGHFLTVTLIGVHGPRDAIGARVSLKTGALHELQTISTCGGFMSGTDRRVHFGLGAQTQVDSLEVHWPGGHVDTFHNLPADRFLIITEGKIRWREGSGG
ncbi:MAG: ASPIC/UnbV domain-containing protein [Armatimonadota bacterium]|nr:ASPIC/UnbV domain-containing protein [Armatimonadota bacterium]